MHLPEMGFWDSIVITLLFSFAVIGMDEIIHRRRAKRQQHEGGNSPGH